MPFAVERVLARSARAHGLGDQARTVVEGVTRAGFLYGSAPTSHLGLLARVREYTPKMLDIAVVRERELVRVRAMRGSVYLVPTELAPYALAFTPLKTIAHYAKLAGVTVAAFPAIADHVEAVVGERPRTAAEIREELGTSAPSGSGVAAIIARMAREGRIVRAGVRGGPSSQSYEYARMADWIKLPKTLPSVVDALTALGRAWLAANGPATAKDLAWWAGASVRDAKLALAAMKARTLTIDGIAGELYATEAVLDELAKKSRAPDEEDVHLLPVWDAYTMAHADRARYLEKKRRVYVVDPAGNVTNVIVRAGRVVGVWDVHGATLLCAPFEKIAKDALLAAGARLAPVYDVNDVKIVKPRALKLGGKNRFLSPLG